VTDDATIALVTGANKGIGQAIAQRLAGLGMTVLLGVRDPGRGQEAAAALREAGGDVHPVVLDVTDPAGIQAAAGQVASRFGRLDVLVNNAGIPGRQVPGAVSLDLVRAVFETNFFGVIMVTEALLVLRLPLLRRSPTGAEIFCAIRSYLATAARHGIGMIDALTRAAAGTPWIPGTT
jgi:NAD(P)-dependent dehydrogenase (short-subunit alcohol dehydrogenase family)